VAQSVAHLSCKQVVRGSSPLASSHIRPCQGDFGRCECEPTSARAPSGSEASQQIADFGRTAANGHASKSMQQAMQRILFPKSGRIGTPVRSGLAADSVPISTSPQRSGDSAAAVSA
jgi:hypothetical protein